jgi:hypothetical protein
MSQQLQDLRFSRQSLKNGVFWDVMSCGSCKNRRFGGTYLHSMRRLLVTASVVPSSPIFFHPDEGAAKFLRNVSSYKSHTA